GIGYQIRPWMSVWLGYAWVSVFADATGTRLHENRIWEQLTLDYRNIPGFLFQSRTRFEQRFADGLPFSPVGLFSSDEVSTVVTADAGASQLRLAVTAARFLINGLPVALVPEGFIDLEAGQGDCDALAADTGSGPLTFPVE
ncbi:MAG: DUF2490 domain-containing protein, partial [Polyangiales bacterium]